MIDNFFIPTLLITILALYAITLIPISLDKYNKFRERSFQHNVSRGGLFAGAISSYTIEKIGLGEGLQEDHRYTIITVYPDYPDDTQAILKNRASIAFASFPENPYGQWNIPAPDYLTIPIENLRGYFQHDDEQKRLAVYIHYDEDGYWKILKIPAKNFNEITDIESCLAALSITTPDQLKLAFARRPPYVYHELSHAIHVRQRITGDWEELKPQLLYLMPTYLVFLNEDEKVERCFSTEYLWEIEALPRIEDSTTGVVRFRYGEELFSIALADHETWAKDLAQAASKAQEMPVEAEILELKKKLVD